MSDAEARWTDEPVLRRMVDSLVAGLGPRLQSIVLYGSAARGDYQKATSDYNLLLVTHDLEPATLEAAAPILRRWVRGGQPMPRLFSPRLIAQSADVFPIEFLDLQSHRVVLHGRDPFEGVVIGTAHLRLQCERELREKLMRLREGYVQAGGRARPMRRLLTDSYTTFAALFRGCLHLLGTGVPLRNEEVIATFCRRAQIDRAPFDEVDGLKRGRGSAGATQDLFARYYGELSRAVERIDRFDPGSTERA